MMTPAQREEARQLVVDLVRIRSKAKDLEMWTTYRALCRVVEKVGWEINRKERQ